MSILDYLDKRCDTDELAKSLSVAAKKLVNEVTSHQKRVIKIMPEYDLHDEEHLSKVEEIMALYIGKENLNEFSYIDLFLLVMAAWLHDCGMAPSDWELKALSLTEGTDCFSLDANSACNDLKTPFKFSEATRFIEDKKKNLYSSFTKDVSEWLFSPKTERELIESLASELKDYQEFRNGYAMRVNEVRSVEEFRLLNNEIKTDYIRKTHHIRAERYVKNLEGYICSVTGKAWSKRLVKDLSKICRSHGESLQYATSLDTDVQYTAGIHANPQFVAMMLRLSDIVQFSENRAPIVLRNAMKFESDFSYQQWTMKSGLNYAIDNGEVSYSIFCESPMVYYRLQDYLDWVDDEIRNFNMVKDDWDKQYRIPLKKVDRKDVTFDSDSFTPARGKKFRLEQNKILNLLMGLKLYKNEFVGIRELYQNSLDACRCKVCQNSKFEGEIEFGLKDEKGEQYLYCLDNGIGMSETVIENYLLNIGSSYYQSEDYFRSTSTWSETFVPTSQFGIGILSCFMIGKKLEITTKNAQDKCYVSCCIDGPTEYFYYKRPNEQDKELIGESGTIVKVFLKEKYTNSINVNPIEKLGLVMQYQKSNIFSGEFSKYDAYYTQWDNHLYKYVSEFVSVPFDTIIVGVRLSDGSLLKIMKRPKHIKFGTYGLEKEDVFFVNMLAQRNFCDSPESIYELQNKYVDYNVLVDVEGVQYRSMLSLPMPDAPKIDDRTYLFMNRLRGCNICVDGIGVTEHISSSLNKYQSFLTQSGTLNFTGVVRPSLTVDRTGITSMPENFDDISRELALRAISSMINTTIQHIKKYGFEGNINACNQLWEYLFRRISQIDILFVNQMSSTDLGRMEWPCLNKFVGKDISICDFMKSTEIVLKAYNYWEMDTLTQKLVLAKLISADYVSVMPNDSVFIKTSHIGYMLEDENRFYNSLYLVKVNEENGVFKHSDIISNLYPLTSGFVFDAFCENSVITPVNNRVLSVQAFSNGVTAFYSQDSRLVKPDLGMYSSRNDFIHQKDYEVYNFDSKISDIAMHYFGEKRVRDKKMPKFMLTAYIAPHQLTEVDKKLVKSHNDEDSDYGRGLKEGWSILATGMEKTNLIILPGKHTREEMINAVPQLFWETYKELKFVFLNGDGIRINR